MKVIINLTRVKILPTGVESKKSIGALKIEVINPEKKASEAFSPKSTANIVLKNTKTALADEIRA